MRPPSRVSIAPRQCHPKPPAPTLHPAAGTVSAGSGCTQSPDVAFHERGARSRVGGRHHVHSHAPGLALSGGGTGRLQPPPCRMGHRANANWAKVREWVAKGDGAALG
jgi:hypothetical protein